MWMISFGCLFSTFFLSVKCQYIAYWQMLRGVPAVKKGLNVNMSQTGSTGKGYNSVALDEITHSPGSKARVRSRIGYTVATLNDRTHSPSPKVRVRSHIL